MTRTPKISIPLPMIWMKWSIDGSKLLTAFSIFAPPTAAGAQPIITIGSGNCSRAGPGLVAIATEARDDGPVMSRFGGEFNESTQHLLILADEEVCEWRGMHGDGSRRNRRLSCGSAGRAVNVWRTSRERLRGGTRAASIGSWLAMEGLLQRHAGGLWERCGLRSAKRFREALPPVGRYGGSHRASNDRPQLSAERSGVTAAAAPTAPARLISAPGGGHCALRWRVAE